MTTPHAIGPEMVQRAQQGSLAAIDAILVGIQPMVYGLAVRMLGNREDARDTCQEVLLTVVTHLGGFRGEAAFTTWVFQIARRHLLRAATRTRETPEVSFAALEERLAARLELTATDDSAALTPEDKAAAREVALACTQGMVMILDRDHRLAYLLHVVFGLSSEQAALVLEISPAAYRQRLSRARRDLHGFLERRCGLVNEAAECRCSRQVRPVRMLAAAGSVTPHLAASVREREQAAEWFDRLVRMGDAAAVFRAHPAFEAPDAIVGAIRAVLRDAGYWQG